MEKRNKLITENRRRYLSLFVQIAFAKGLKTVSGKKRQAAAGVVAAYCLTANS